MLGVRVISVIITLCDGQSGQDLVGFLFGRWAMGNVCWFTQAFSCLVDPTHQRNGHQQYLTDIQRFMLVTHTHTQVDTYTHIGRQFVQFKYQTNISQPEVSLQWCGMLMGS